MRLIVDISPSIAIPKTGIGRLIDNLLPALKRQGVDLAHFAFVARGYLPSLKKRYSPLFAPPLPARFSRRLLSLAQKHSLPLNWFTGHADATLSFDAVCLPLRGGITTALVADTTPITNPEWHQPATIRLFTERLASIKRHANLIIAISEETKHDLTVQAHISREKIIVAYPGLPSELDKKPTPAQVNRICKRYSVPPTYLIFVGTQEPRKNLARVVEAIGKVRHHNPNLSLVIVGSHGWGPKTAYPNWVYPLGYVPDSQVAALIAGAKALVFPSLKEGFGFPILEGFALRVPVITSNRSSMSEVSRGVAIEVNPENESSLAAGIQRVLKLTPRQRQQRVAKGKKRLTHFSFDTMTQQIIDAIKNQL